jgi:glycosyltransferase involved in cell wall biosynthesis
MDWRSQCAVVIPCLNEGESIAAVVRGACGFLPKIYVVDDGSRDDTAAQAAGEGAEVLRHAVSQGKGAAFLAGMNKALSDGFSWVLAMDGDGQHAPGDIPRFLECAEKCGAGMVIGNRMNNPVGMPCVRRLVNRWMSSQISRWAGRTLPDSQCGFRLMKGSVLTRLDITTRHFEIESELLIGFILAGEDVAYVPIEVIYRFERSKIRPVRDTWRWFNWWWRLRGFPRPSPGSRAVHFHSDPV